MIGSVDPDELLDNGQAAAMLGLKPNTLEIWRCKGKGPPFVKLSTGKRGHVRYVRSELMHWLRQQTFASTSAYTAAARARTRQHVCGSI